MALVVEHCLSVVTGPRLFPGPSSLPIERRQPPRRRRPRRVLQQEVRRRRQHGLGLGRLDR